MESNQPLDYNMSEQTALSEQAYTHLRKSGGWAMFLAILGFLGAGIMILSGVGLSAMSGFGGNELSEFMPFRPIMLGLLYLGIGLIYLIPIIYLYRFAQKAREIGQSRHLPGLEQVLQLQFRVYQITGIMVILFIVLYIVIIFAFVSFGMSMGSTQF